MRRSEPVLFPDAMNSRTDRKLRQNATLDFHACGGGVCIALQLILKPSTMPVTHFLAVSIDYPSSSQGGICQRLEHTAAPATSTEARHRPARACQCLCRRCTRSHRLHHSRARRVAVLAAIAACSTRHAERGQRSTNSRIDSETSAKGHS